MLSVREVGLVALREIRRNLRSAKGIAMFALFFLGGLVSTMIGLAWGVVTMDIPAEAADEVNKQALAATLGKDVADVVLHAPGVTLWLFRGTLTFLPFVVLLLGFDQIAGEVQHRTLRYSAGRATRPSIVAGKALGIWAVTAVMITVLHVTVWAIAIGRGGPAGAILGWGMRFLVLSAISSAAYVGFTSLVSSFFRTPIVALFAGVGSGIGLGLLYYVFFVIEKVGTSLKNNPKATWHIPDSLVSAAGVLTWLFPNQYENLLIRPDVPSILGGLALFIVWGGLCVAGASSIVQRRDI